MCLTHLIDNFSLKPSGSLTKQDPEITLKIFISITKAMILEIIDDTDDGDGDDDKH